MSLALHYWCTSLLRAPSPKWPILCRVGRKTLLYIYNLIGITFTFKMSSLSILKCYVNTKSYAYPVGFFFFFFGGSDSATCSLFFFLPSLSFDVPETIIRVRINHITLQCFDTRLGGIQPVKNWALVSWWWRSTNWLKLCTSYSSSCHHHRHHP